MEIKDLIDLIKDDCVEYMKQTHIPVTNTIGKACVNLELDISNEDDILENNDIYGVGEKYESIYESIDEYFSANDVSTNTEVFDHIIDEYNINQLKEEIEKEMIIDTTTVDIDSEPFMDHYTVKGIEGTEALSTCNKNEAVAICEESKDQIVTNSRGDIVYTNIPPEEMPITIKSDNLEIGTEITTNNTNLYIDCMAEIPLRSINITCYISQETCINGRYAVCAQPDKVGDPNFVFGYIKKADIV